MLYGMVLFPVRGKRLSFNSRNLSDMFTEVKEDICKDLQLDISPQRLLFCHQVLIYEKNGL